MPDAPEHDALLDTFDAAAGGPVERLMRCDIATYLIDDILQKVDRATMAVSLEARNPLLDPAVVARRAALRRCTRRQGPGRKPLLRDALRLVLPDELVDRPKMGFTVPHTAWLRGELKELLDDLVLSGARRALPPLDGAPREPPPRRRQPHGRAPAVVPAGVRALARPLAAGTAATRPGGVMSDTTGRV